MDALRSVVLTCQVRSFFFEYFVPQYAHFSESNNFWFMLRFQFTMVNFKFVDLVSMSICSVTMAKKLLRNKASLYAKSRSHRCRCPSGTMQVVPSILTHVRTNFSATCICAWWFKKYSWPRRFRHVPKHLATRRFCQGYQARWCCDFRTFRRNIEARCACFPREVVCVGSFALRIHVIQNRWCTDRHG